MWAAVSPGQVAPQEGRDVAQGTIGLRKFVVELEDMPQVVPCAQRDVRSDALEDRGKSLVLTQCEPDM